MSYAMTGQQNSVLRKYSFWHIVLCLIEQYHLNLPQVEPVKV